MNRKEFVVSLDIDDVIVPFVSSFVDFYNQATGDKVVYDSINSFDLSKNLPSLDDGEAVRDFMKGFTQTHHFKNITPIKGALEGINHFRNNGYNVIFTTSRYSRSIRDTYKWFSNNGLGIKNIYFTKDKGWVANELGASVHVDDGLHNLESIASQTTALPIVFTQPWNKDSSIYKRVSNWSELVDAVDQYYVDRFIKSTYTL